MSKIEENRTKGDRFPLLSPWIDSVHGGSSGSGMRH
jgi:hypothetical protein